MGAEDTAQLQATLAIDEIQDLLLQTGFNKPITSLTADNKEEISRAIVDYHLMAKVKCIMDQFMEGLKEFGLLTNIKEQPTFWEPMFVYSTANGITRGSYVFCTSLMHFDVCLHRWPKSSFHCPFLGEGFE